MQQVMVVQGGGGGIEGWQDVGGLADVQAALQEALELPTKYAALIARSPPLPVLALIPLPLLSLLPAATSTRLCHCSAVFDLIQSLTMPWVRLNELLVGMPI